MTLSLHALARRFERGRDRSQAAVIADLGALLRPWRAGAMPVAVKDGVWLGEPAHTTECGVRTPLFDVGTYVDIDDFNPVTQAQRAARLAEQPTPEIIIQ